MNGQNKVSIIIPVYNAEMYLSRCVNSFIKQSYNNCEIILINDGSTDSSLSVMRQYSHHNNVVIIDKGNEGVAKTRNYGISIATGQYIMFADDDDFVDRDYVECYINRILDTQADIVIGGYKRVDNKGKRILTKYLTNSQWSKYIVMAPWAKIYSKRFLENNDIKFLSYPIGEDDYFILNLLYYKPKVEFISNIGYSWFYNSNSVSNTSQKGLNTNLNITYLLTEMKSVTGELDDLTKYFYYRYCVWYLLFSGKTATPNMFIKQFEEEKKWMISNDCYDTISPFSTKLKGESLRDRIAVFAVKMSDRLHIINLFAKLYCK